MRDLASGKSLRVEAFDDCDFVGFTSLIADPSNRALFEEVDDKLREKGLALRPRRGDCYAAFLNSELYDHIIVDEAEGKRAKGEKGSIAPWVAIRLPGCVPQTLLPSDYNQTVDDALKNTGAYSPRRISKLAKLRPSLFFPEASVVVAMDFKLTPRVDLHDLADYALRPHQFRTHKLREGRKEEDATTVHLAAFQHICVADFPRGGLGNNSLPCDPSASYTAAGWMVQEAKLVKALKRTEDGDSLVAQARRYAVSIPPTSQTYAESALVFWRITSRGDAIAKMWLEEFLGNSDRDQPALSYVLNKISLKLARGVRLLPPALPACGLAPIPACDPSLHRVEMPYAAGRIEELLFGSDAHTDPTCCSAWILSVVLAVACALGWVAFHFKLFDIKALLRYFYAKKKRLHVK